MIAHLHHVVERAAAAHIQVRDIEPFTSVPAHRQLLLREFEQVIQTLVVDLTV